MHPKGTLKIHEAKTDGTKKKNRKINNYIGYFNTSFSNW